MQVAKFRKKRNPLQYPRMLRVSAFEPAKSFFFFGQRDVNGRDDRRRDISLLPGLEKLGKNISRLHLPTPPVVADGKAAPAKLRRILSLDGESDSLDDVAVR